MTTIGIILALLFLEWPLKGIVIGLLALFEIVEISLFLKWRRRRSMTGADGMIGAAGVAIGDCTPNGQVKVKGGIWQARCEAGVRGGDQVTVIAVDGLVLEVEPQRAPSPAIVPRAR